MVHTQNKNNNNNNNNKKGGGAHHTYFPQRYVGVHTHAYINTYLGRQRCFARAFFERATDAR